MRELRAKPELFKAVAVGASIAATLAVVVVVVRSRKRRGPTTQDTSSGVLGTILKSALFAALQTVVKVKAQQLASKALHFGENPTPAQATHE